MNAIRCEKREDAVLTHEAIEVHLSYLRTGLEAMQTELPKVREKIEAFYRELCGKTGALDEKLTGKIEALDERLTGKIEALDEKLTDKIEALDERVTGKIAALDEKLTGRIGALDERLSAKIDSLDAKIDRANEDRAAGDARLGEKIDKLAEVVTKMQGSLDGIKWFVATCAIVASGISVSRSLGWI